MAEISPDRIIKGQASSSGIEIDPSRLQSGSQKESADIWKGLYVKSRPYLKTVAEGLGLGGGAFIGAPAGPLGVLAGGALGYGISKESIDLLDQAFGIKKAKTLPTELLESAEDIKAGAEMTMSGEIMGAGAGIVGKKAVQALKKVSIPVRKQAIKKKAADILTSEYAATPEMAEQIQNNILAAKNLETKIPGLKFTRGQLTNDADAIVLERALTRSSVKIQKRGLEISGPDLNQEQRAFAERTLQTYYENQLMTGDVKTFTNKLQAVNDSLDATVKQAQETVNLHVARMSRAMDEQEAGRIIRGTLKAEKTVMRKKANALYDKIPNVEVDASPIYRAVEDVIEDFDSLVESYENFPSRIVHGLKKLMKEGTEEGTDEALMDLFESGEEFTILPFQRLRKLRTTIISEARKAKAQENSQLSRRLEMLRQGVEESIDTLMDDPTRAGELYRKASRFYREYAVTFKQATVADVLQAGARGEEGKIALSNIAGRFFTKDGVDDFLRAVGDNEKARNAMQDYAKHTLYNVAYNSYTGQLKTNIAFNWITKNSKVLHKLGIKKELLNIAKAGKTLEISQATLDTFNKSVASRVLNADVSDITKKAFAASKNYSVTARELMDLVGSDRNAIAGLQKAMAEHIFDSSKVTAEGFFTDFKISNAILTRQIKKYSPAMRVIYQNDKRKLSALMKVHKAYQILERTMKSPMGGGSDTAENLANVVIGAVGARAGRFYLIKTIRDYFNKLSDNKVRAYLLRATFDPDYAESLLAMFRNPQNKKVRTHVGNLVAYGIKRTQEE